MDITSVSCLLLTLVLTVRGDPYSRVPTAELCYTPLVAFNKPPSYGSLHFGGVVRLTAPPSDAPLTPPSEQPGSSPLSLTRLTCECRLTAIEEETPQIAESRPKDNSFDIMIKALVLNVSGAACEAGGCSDRMVLQYWPDGALTLLLGGGGEDAVWDRYRQHVTAATLTYTREPGPARVQTLDLDVIATRPLRVSCGAHYEQLTRAAPGEEQPGPADQRPNTNSNSDPPQSKGAVYAVAVLVTTAAVCVLCGLALLLYRKLRNTEKASPSPLAQRSSRGSPGGVEARYVSLEIMQEHGGGGARARITDEDELISFDSPGRSGGGVAARRHSGALAVDLEAAGSPGEYDYIETRDYYAQMGSAPTSPETSALDDSAARTPQRPNTQAHVQPRTEPQTKHHTQPDTARAGLPEEGANQNTTPGATHQDNKYYSLWPEAQSVQDSAACALYEPPSKVNGYGKGAIPKHLRPADNSKC